MKHYGDGTYLVKDKDGKEYKLSVIVDDYADDPRNWDNVAKIWCWHRNYKIGDKPYGDNVQSLEYLCEKYTDMTDDEIYDADIPTMIKKLQESETLVLIFISAYEHGAITISTSSGYPYNDRWDGGVIGFAFIDKETAAENFMMQEGDDWKERAKRCIDGEVKTLDTWLQGEVYGFRLEEKVHIHNEKKCPHRGEVIDVEEYDEWNETASCWGFYGDCIEDNGILDEVGMEIIEEEI